MLSRWPLRFKMLLGAVALAVIVGLLAVGSFRGVYSYRQLARSVSHRASELPIAAELASSVAELRLTTSRIGQRRNPTIAAYPQILDERDRLRGQLQRVHVAIDRYREQLESAGAGDPHFDDNHMEFTTLMEIEQLLRQVDDQTSPERWIHTQLDIDQLNDQLDHMSDLCSELPSHLHQRLTAFAGEVRGQYRTWIIVTWVTTIGAGAVVLGLLAVFYYSIFTPLRILVEDSRRISGGDFEHRIAVRTRDEVAELGEAMNDMTGRFREIRDNLDQLVRERTRELEERTQQLIRSEQLASVGFLAAGVAHEINNPLASIAWCAESLEGRIDDLLNSPTATHSEPEDAEVEVARKYARRIQSEAFRCKGITEKLLDFSRLETPERHATNLTELVRDMIQMVQTIDGYRGKSIELEAEQDLICTISAPQIKQVVLNLLTNALESIDTGGRVQVRLARLVDSVELVVADNGCGMAPEVLAHLFQPFFTRRRDGHGTGLGLSITHRIIDQHQGTIEASSDGPQRGSTMRVTLPVQLDQGEHEKQHRQVA